MEKSKESKKSAKQLTSLFVGVAISVGILAIFVFAIDWQAFLQEIAAVQPLYILPFLLLFYCTYWIRALRWRYLLPSDATLDSKNLYDAFALGALGMFLLPFRAGELIRAYSLQRFERVPFSTGFASVITERAFDVVTLLIIFGICLAQIEQAPPELISAAWILGGLAAGILLAMLLCYFFAEQMLALFRWKLDFIFRDSFPGLREKLVEFAAGTIDGFRAIQSTKELGLVLLLSVALWGTFALFNQAGLWCFGNYPSIWVGATVTVVIALAIAIPSAPGFIGVYQLGCILALSGVFGYTKEFALAYAVLTHSLQFLMVLCLGFLSLHKRGLRLRDMRREAPVVEATA